MKKYWLLYVVCSVVLLTGTTVMQPALAVENPGTSSTSNLSKPSINPTDYIRKLTETPRMKPPLKTPKKLDVMQGVKPTINPTEYILKLTGVPGRNLTGKPMFNLTGVAERKQRLTDLKLKVCQEKSAIILKRSTQLGEMVANMEKKFTSIIDGVKGYYVKKKLTLTNYDELVAAIDTKKSAISPLLEVAKADVSSFSCSGENPAEQLKKYRTDMQAVIAGLQDYRKAIKDLIVAIKGLTIPEVTVTGEPTVVPTSSP